jgi:beta-lactamase regulating signal transducer with metallopeptidase domain
MSLSGAVLIAATVPVRSLAVYRLPKRTFVFLWGAVLLRLLLPFSLPPPLGVLAVGGKAAEVFPLISAAQTYTSPVRADTASPRSPPALAQASFAKAAWLGGTVVCALFFLAAHLRFRREYKAALPLENAYVAAWLRGQKLRRSVRVGYSDRINAPMTYGTLKPVILFPKTADRRDEACLRYILTHEMTHIRRFDTLLKCLLAAAVCVHWFNPLVWVMYVLANRDIELACDEAVVRAFGETAKPAYALALIGLEEKKSGFSPLCNNFAKNAIEERICAIMKTKKPSFMGILSATVLVVTLTAGALTAFAADGGDTTNGNSADKTPGVGDFMFPSDVKFADDMGIKVTVEETQNGALPRSEEFTEPGFDAGSAVFMPTRLVAVNRRDGGKFTEAEWNNILAGIAAGEIRMED